jgi:hypothetical protein
VPPGQIIETNNSLTHPKGPEYQLVVGEGMLLRMDRLNVHMLIWMPQEHMCFATNFI